MGLFSFFKSRIDSHRLQKSHTIIQKKSHYFLDLATLIQKTTKLESQLEYLGGKGKGIFEKAEPLATQLPHYFMQRLIEVAEARNIAVHGSGTVKNLEDLVKKCDALSQVVDDRLRALKMLTVLNLKLQELRYDPTKPTPFEPELSQWISTLKNNYEIYGTEKMQELIGGEKKMLQLLEGHINQFYLKRWRAKAPIVLAVILVITIVAVILKAKYL